MNRNSNALKWANEWFHYLQQVKQEIWSVFSQPVFDCPASIIIMFTRPHFFVLPTYVEIILKIILMWQNSGKVHRTDFKVNQLLFLLKRHP